MFLSVLFLFSFWKAQALETSYIRFQEPQGWSCQKQRSEYLCRSNDPLEKKEAFLVAKAKLSGRGDNLRAFYESLRHPLPMVNATGANGLSKVYSAKQQVIGKHRWIRALHLNALASNYFTEYLVTIKGDLAIGLEFTYHQSRYNKYKTAMDQLVGNLSLVENIASQQPKLSAVKSKPSAPAPFIAENSSLSEAPAKSPNMQMLIYLGIGILLIFGLLLLTKRR